eukprot:1150400-Prymnesium_polylepis.1
MPPGLEPPSFHPQPIDRGLRPCGGRRRLWACGTMCASGCSHRSARRRVPSSATCGCPRSRRPSARRS